MTAKTVYVGIYETWADWEVGLAVAHVNRVLWQREPGRYQIKTVAETMEPVTTMGGLRILPDVTIDEITPDGSAMLILAGADTWMDGNTAFAKKAREFLEAGVPVAAICGATYGLAAEGLLNDYEHTSGVLEFVAAAPAYSGADKYRDDVLAVTDGNLITASPVGGAEFAREVLTKLDVYTPEVMDAWYRLFGDQDGSGYAVLAAAE